MTRAANDPASNVPSDAREGRGRIHAVSCSFISPPVGTDGFDAAEAAAKKIERFARKLGFSAMYENVDEAEIGDRYGA